MSVKVNEESSAGNGAAGKKFNLTKAKEWAEFVAGIATVFSLLFLLVEVGLIYLSVRATSEALDRPALLFSQNADAKLIRRGREYSLQYVITVLNQGSGNAYNIVWRQADQIPPLYSSALSKEETLRSYELSHEAFKEGIPQEVRNMVVGAGMAQTMTIANRFTYSPHGVYRIKKYFAAFYESESGRRNVSVIGLSVNLDRDGQIVAAIDEEVIVRDLRFKRQENGRVEKE